MSQRNHIKLTGHQRNMADVVQRQLKQDGMQIESIMNENKHSS